MAGGECEDDMRGKGGGDKKGAVKGERKRERDSVKGGGKKEILGNVSSEGVILETNQWLIHSLGLAELELSSMAAYWLPVECIRACLWKARGNNL